MMASENTDEKNMAIDSTANSTDNSLHKVEEAQSPPQPTAPTFPEGGTQAWLTLFGASLVQYCTFGYMNAFGVYQDFYVREYLTNHTPSDIGWIGGVQIFLTFFCGIFTGRAFDRGYFHHMMIAGAFIHALSYFMLSLSHPGKYYQVFLSHGLGGGLSTGITYIPSLAIVSHYFQRHRPLAMGIVAASNALGAVIHPIMLNKLFHGPVGFYNGVRISAALNTGLLIIANFTMRTRLPPKKAGSAIPIMEFMRDPPYFVEVLGGILLISGTFFPIFYLQLDAISHGVDRQLAFYSIPVMNAAAVFGRIIPNLFVPKLGVFNLMIFFCFIMGVLIFAMIAVKDLAGTMVFAIFFGFFSGGAISLNPPMIASLAKSFDEIGARIGVSFAISSVFGLVATPISGALLSRELVWWKPAIYGGVMMVGSAVCFSGTRYLLVKRKGTQIV